MALEGKLIWKGLEVKDAYAIVDYTSSNVLNSIKINVTPATFNDDGSVKTELIEESTWVKSTNLEYILKVYSNKAARDAQPEQHLYIINGSMTPKTLLSSKNFIIQAYEELKTLDEYKHLASV